MAVPTITSFSPSTVPPLAKRMVRVVGTNFKVWPIPAPNGGMWATVDGAAVTIKVCSPTLAFLFMPYVEQRGPYDATVVIGNLDSAGAHVAGESATKKIVVSSEAVVSPDAEPHTAAVLRRLEQLLKVHFNIEVAYSTDVDYTRDGEVLRVIAKPPALILADLVLGKSDIAPADLLISSERIYRDTLIFKMRGNFIIVAEKINDSLRFQAALYLFQKRVPYIDVDGIRTRFALDTSSTLGQNVGEGIKTWSLGFALEPLCIEAPEEIDIAFLALTDGIITTEGLTP